MTTTCFICGLRISNAEGFMLSYLNIGIGDTNKAAYTCKTYHKKPRAKQTKREFEYRKLVELEKRVEQLETIYNHPLFNRPSPPPPPSILSTFTFNKNGHLEGCQCIRCFDVSS